MSLGRADLSQAMQAAYSRLGRLVASSTKPLVIYLEAGHYVSAKGPDEFSTASLGQALALATNLILDFKEKIRIVFGILQDDLGMKCDDNACSLPMQNHKTLDGVPEALLALLRQSPVVKLDKLMLFSERSAKNRGINRLRRLAKEDSSQSGIHRESETGREGIFFSSLDRQEIPLVLITEQRWVAKCPTLMGQHYADVLIALGKRFPPEYPVAIVDVSDLMDRNKVGRGSEAALRLFCKDLDKRAELHIINLFFEDPSGDVFISEDYDSRDF